MGYPKKPVVLVVDDTIANIRILDDLLRGEYTVRVATNGATALRLALSEPRPDIVLLDIMMPDMDGYEVCRRLKSDPLTSNIAVVFITAMGNEEHEAKGLDLGAVDFIAKPFDQNVLMAKVLALLRRTYDFGQAVPVLEHRGALLSTGDGTLTYQGRRIPLTKNEYRILLALLQSKGRVVSREKLMERLWQTDSFVDENTLSVNVGRLRKKLEQAGLNDFITTKFGVGYLIG